MKINDELLYKIGKNVNLEYWDGISKEEQQEYIKNDRDDKCYNAKIIYFGNLNLPLVYMSRQPTSTSEYTINLKTCKPTKNSFNQTKLPDDIIKF